MIKVKWTLRLGILGAVVSVAIVAMSSMSACRDANKEGTATTTSEATKATAPTAAGGDHSKEEFCKIIVKQFESLSKFDPSDVTKRAKYFADQKELNASLVKTAPTSLASDVAFQTKNANAMMDAQLASDATKIKASAAVLRSPENLAASKRMSDYCGVTPTVSH